MLIYLYVGIYSEAIMGALASQITSLIIVYSTATGEFPAQMASNAENVSIWWRHHAISRPSGRYMSLMRILENIYRVVTAPDCIVLPLQSSAMM